MQAVRTFFGRHPIISNVVVYGSLYTGAEFAQQTFTKKIMKKEDEAAAPYDTGVLFRYSVMGTCVFPHVLYHTYKYLDARFLGSSMRVVLPKLAVDTFLVTPFNITLFYLGMNVMEGNDILAEWKKKFVPTFITASVFWVPMQLINFRFFPPSVRVIFVGSCQVIWVSILCWFKRQEF